MLKAVVNVLLAIVFSETAVICRPFRHRRTWMWLVLRCVPHAGVAQSRPTRAGQDQQESLGVVTDAPTVLVRDVRSGVALVQQDAGVRRPIASITKLMTAIVLVEDYTWSPADAATVLREDVRSGGDGTSVFRMRSPWVICFPSCWLRREITKRWRWCDRWARAKMSLWRR